MAEPGLILNPENPSLDTSNSEVLPPIDRGDVTNLDKQDLASYINGLVLADIRDIVDFGWKSKREYDYDSYYMIKNEALRMWPWKGASNSRVPLTPTLLDTAHANIRYSAIPDDNKPAKVRGIGVEDIRKAPILEQFLNWKITNETNLEMPMDSNIFRTLHNGTGVMKIRRDFDNSITLSSLDIENFIINIDAKGVQLTDTDHCGQFIPMSYTDVLARREFYEDTDKMIPGIGVTNNLAIDDLRRKRDLVSGTSMDERSRRDLYYMLEFYCTYYPNSSHGLSGSSRFLSKPMELIVWMSPNGGTIHRVRVNEDRIRPFSRYVVYPINDRFYGQSLPEKIRGIQEDIDYANKQNTDALDRAISPAMFVDDTESFDRSRAQRVPGGIYPKGANNPISYEPVPPVNPGFERKMLDLWGQAERLTGLIDVTQGGATVSGRTLGETEIRTTRADIRFSTLLSRFGLGWKDTLNIIYTFSNKYEDRNKKLKVLGYTDLKTLNEIFPTEQPTALGLNLEGKFDFGTGGLAITEKNKMREDAILFHDTDMRNPLIVSNPANLWRASKNFYDAMGRRDFESIVPKPKEVDIYSPAEFIERVISGQYDLQVRPGIDSEAYVFEIELFMRTESFGSLDQKAQTTLLNALRRAFVMSVAEKTALSNLNQAMMQRAQLNQMGQGGGMDGMGNGSASEQSGGEIEEPENESEQPGGQPTIQPGAIQ